MYIGVEEKSSVKKIAGQVPMTLGDDADRCHLEFPPSQFQSLISRNKKDEQDLQCGNGGTWLWC